MANEMNITQNLRKMTLDLPTDTVTVQIVVKILKVQYGVCQNNNHRETTFNPWSEDLQPTESFMRIVREMQIKPDRYYLETCMHQTLSENYGHNDHAPKVWVHTPPQDDNEEDLQIHSPCPSNWSDDLLEIDENKAQNNKQMNQPANQFINSTGTRVPQDMLAHASTTLRIPTQCPRHCKFKNKTKLNSMENPDKRLDLLTKLGRGKGHKSMTNRNRNEDYGRKKNGQVF